MTTPHVMAQVRLEPGGSRSWPGQLPKGPYRARDLRGGPYAEFEHDGAGTPSILLTEDEVRLGEAIKPGMVSFGNLDNVVRYVVVECRDWASEALTAAHATTLQAFRDLCAAEALRPGDSTGVSHVTLMFTDMLDSTALFEEHGDALAFAKVREHFAWIAHIVRNHDGGVVKTMGDAVLAAFHEPKTSIGRCTGNPGRHRGFQQPDEFRTETPDWHGIRAARWPLRSTAGWTTSGIRQISPPGWKASLRAAISSCRIHP